MSHLYRSTHPIVVVSPTHPLDPPFTPQGESVPEHLPGLNGVFRLLEQGVPGDAAQLLGRARVRPGDALRERRGRTRGLDVHDHRCADGGRRGTVSTDIVLIDVP